MITWTLVFLLSFITPREKGKEKEREQNRQKRGKDTRKNLVDDYTSTLINETREK